MPKMTLAQTLESKIALLSDNQKAFFNRMYPQIPTEQKKVKWAISQCENSIEKNNKNKETILTLFNEKKEMQSNFINKFGDVDNIGIVDSTRFQEMSDLLNFVEVIVPPIVLITDGLSTTPADQQLDFPKYENEAQARECLEDEYDLFDCGQGYYQDEASTYCYIANVFFEADLKAVVYGNKQDVGDKLYYVDSIKVTRLIPSHESKYLQEKRRSKLQRLAQMEAEVEKLKKELAE